MADLDAGADAGADDEDRRLGPALGEALVLADERRHRRREADALDLLEVDEAPDQRAQLVRRALRLRGDAPVLEQLGLAVEPEDGLRVARVDCEEHGVGALRVVVGRVRLADALGQGFGGEARLRRPRRAAPRR